MKIQEWLNHHKTRQIIAVLEGERQKRLEAILSANNKEEAAAVTVGFSEAIKFIKGLEESDAPDDSD